MAKKTDNACPCCSKLPYAECCGRYLDGGLTAPTAEALMRSRYTAYTLRREDYVLRTWHPAKRPVALGLSDEDASQRPTQWIDLEVQHHVLKDASNAIVEFVARYRINGRAYRLHEISHFVREDGCWLYFDGEMT